mmetsp:Transcript_19559/g.54351  ORF Transcript_19559/g.54351 Transcript_19559/m.54351 type:complete len:243 (-) Transcript_19559:339-1067(-)
MVIKVLYAHRAIPAHPSHAKLSNFLFLIALPNASALSARYTRTLARERPRWLILFFASFSISAYVLPPLSSGSKTGSHPKSSGPLGCTIFPFVRPSKTWISSPGPAEKATTVCAYADRSSNPSSMRFSPSWPHFSRNHLMYGPGMPLSALKHREVSSVRTAPPTRSAASLHFSAAISSGSPCSSGRSIFWFVMANGNGVPLLRICCTSSSFFLLPVTKVIVGLESADMLRRWWECGRWDCEI